MHAQRLAEGEAEDAAFGRLALREGVAIGSSMRKLQGEVDQLKRREMIGRAKYKELDDGRRSLRARIEELRAKRDSRDAERLNEVALEADLKPSTGRYDIMNAWVSMCISSPIWSLKNPSTSVASTSSSPSLPFDPPSGCPAAASRGGQ